MHQLCNMEQLKDSNSFIRTKMQAPFFTSIQKSKGTAGRGSLITVSTCFCLAQVTVFWDNTVTNSDLNFQVTVQAFIPEQLLTAKHICTELVTIFALTILESLTGSTCVLDLRKFRKINQKITVFSSLPYARAKRVHKPVLKSNTLNQTSQFDLPKLFYLTHYSTFRISVPFSNAKQHQLCNNCFG